MSKIKNTVVKKAKDKSPGYADHVGFEELYVIKGIRGFFITVGKPNKSNLIGMREWGTNMISRKAITVNVNMITCLGHLIFDTTAIEIIKEPVDNTRIEKVQLSYNNSLRDLQDSDKLNEKSFNKLQQEFEKTLKDIRKDPKFLYKDVEKPVIVDIKTVMNNLHDYEKYSGESNLIEIYQSFLSQQDIEGFMEIIVPQYNPEKFKKHHLKDCIKWYSLLKQYLIDFDEIIRKSEEDK